MGAQIHLNGLADGPDIAAFGRTIEDQAARLGDARLQTTQRQALAAQTARKQGNRHLQRVLASAKGGPIKVPLLSKGAHLNRLRIPVDDVGGVQRQGGSVTVGAAAETVTESHGEFADRLLSLMEQNPEMSVQEALRRTVEMDIHSAPNIAETRDLILPISESLGNEYGIIVANANYAPHDTDLDRPPQDAARMQAQLSSRGYRTTVHCDLNSEAILNAFLDPLLNASILGDKVVLFYSGHGEIEGLKGVDGQLLTVDRFEMLRDLALRNWVELTIILESCHSGSVADFFRRQEIRSLRDYMPLIPNSEAAAEFVAIAENIQRIKDEITQLEATKQACLNITEDELRRDPSVADRAVQRADALNPRIQAAWETALLQLVEYQAQVYRLSRVVLPLPEFEAGHWENFWTNQAQLDVLSTMINQVLTLARGGGAQCR